MPRNEWFHIAEIMQQREVNLINKIYDIVEDQDLDDRDIVIHVINALDTHLTSTGRRQDVRPQIKELSEVDSDTRSKLLALLGTNQEQPEVSSQPIQVVTQKLTKSGKPRKQRSDKGQPRGKREKK